MPFTRVCSSHRRPKWRKPRSTHGPTTRIWTNPEFSQPADAIQRLGTIYSILDSGPVLKLRNPPREDEHDYGFVTGSLGFHEFIVIDRILRTLHVIVASDD